MQRASIIFIKVDPQICTYDVAGEKQQPKIKHRIAKRTNGEYIVMVVRYDLRRSDSSMMCLDIPFRVLYSQSQHIFDTQSIFNTQQS